MRLGEEKAVRLDFIKLNGQSVAKEVPEGSLRLEDRGGFRGVATREGED
jgi:hypothetical protein